MVFIVNIILMFGLPFLFFALLIRSMFVYVNPKTRKILILSGLLLSIFGLAIMFIGRFQPMVAYNILKIVPVDLFSIGVIIFLVGLSITRFKEKKLEEGL